MSRLVSTPPTPFVVGLFEGLAFGHHDGGRMAKQEDMFDIIEQCWNTGLSKAAFACRAGVPINIFHYWCRRFEREYDGRLCRRWNCDPVDDAKKGPYARFSNSPIWRVDPNGDDDFFTSDGTFKETKGSGHKIRIWSEEDKSYIPISKVD